MDDWWNSGGGSAAADAAPADTSGDWWKNSSFFGSMGSGDATAQAAPQNSGFFGGLVHGAEDVGKAAESVGKGVGSFFGGIVKGIANDAVNTVKTAKNIGQAVYEDYEAPRQENANMQTFNQAKSDLDNGKISLNEFNQKYKEFQAAQSVVGSHIAGEGIVKDKQSALGQGASAANTFINVATLGIGSGVKALAEGGAKDVIEAGAKGGFTDAVKKGAQVLLSNDESAPARQALHDIVNGGGSPAVREALDHIGNEAATQGIVGGAQGGLNSVEQNPNATTSDILHGALVGGLTSGGLGAGGGVLDKDVRTGLKEIPGQLSNVKLRPLSEQTGSVINPFTIGQHASGGNLHELPTAEDAQSNLAQSVAAEFKGSPADYVKESADTMYQHDKGIKGGQLQSTNNPNGPDEYYRTSEHTDFYSKYYAETGHAPSKAAYAAEAQRELSGEAPPNIIDPGERDVYQLLQDRKAGTNATLNAPEGSYEAMRQQHLAALNGDTDSAPAINGPANTKGSSKVPAGLPARPGTGQIDIEGNPYTLTPPSDSRRPAGLPKGPQKGQGALPGQSAEEQVINPSQFYHGTGSTNLNPATVDSTVTRPDGLFGQGVYMTDNPDIARGYATARGNSNSKYVYKVDLHPKKTLDLEGAVPQDAQPAFMNLAHAVEGNYGDGSFETDIKNMMDKGESGSKIYKVISNEIRDQVANGDRYAAEASPDFTDDLTKAGYDTMTHKGGKITGKPSHKVMIALDPHNIYDNNLENPIKGMNISGEESAPVNNLIDFIDPHKLQDLRSEGSDQTALETNPQDPYANFEQNLNRPALGPGKTEDLTPKEAKAQFKRTGNAPSIENTLPAGGEPIPLNATADETRDSAIVKETPKGKVVLLDKNPARAGKDVQRAIEHIAEDDTGSRFTSTRTPEMNLEEATIPRGGVNSKEFRALAELPKSIRQHTADYTDYVEQQKEFANKFVKEFNWSPKKDLAARQYIEAETPEDRETVLLGFKKDFGEKSASALEPLRQKWIKDKESLRNDANAEIEKYAGKDHTIGDLGENYLPRVYKQGGIKGFRNTIMDLKQAGLDKIGGPNGMFNLQNTDGYLSKESDTAGGVLRGSEGIPLNSEFAKPNTMYLSQAQARTAKDPQGELEGALASMVHYHQAVGRAKYFTQDIAKGRSIQKVIAAVHEKTGNLRQMNNSYDDMINSLAGKTSRFDRQVVDSKFGNKVVNTATKIQRNIAKSTILGSANSALAQTGQLPLVLAETGAKNFHGGMQDMFKYLGKKNDAVDPMAKSSFMRTRYPAGGEDPFVISKAARAGNKATDVIAKPFRIIEKASTDLAWRSSYQKALADGFKGSAAIDEADRIAAKIVGERSPGARAAIYESKALGPVTSYTLEVNQMYQIAKQYFKRDPKKAVALVGAIWLYNQGYQALTGNRLNADPLEAGIQAGKALTQSTDPNTGLAISPGSRILNATGRLAGSAVDAVPLGDEIASQFYPTKGFHIPFGGGADMLSKASVFGNSNFGRYGGTTPLASGIGNPLLALGIPGAAQLQRSVEGVNAYNAGGSVSPAGQTRFAIAPGTENYLRALLWGQYGTQEGQQYLAGKNNNIAGG